MLSQRLAQSLCFTVGGTSSTLDPSMEAVSCETKLAKQKVYLLTLLPTTISYELKQE